MTIPYLPLLQGDDHANIEMLYRYLNAVIAAFVSSVNEAVNGDTINNAIIADTVNNLVDPATFADASVPFVKLQEITDNIVTLDKIQQLSASRLLGRGEGAGDGDVQQLTVGSNGLSLLGTVLDTSQVLASGTYTPTVTLIANLDTATPFVCQYLRVGSVVTVSGRIDIDPTATGLIIVDLSLPIPSDFTAITQCAGVGSDTAGVQVASIAGNAALNRARFRMTALGTVGITMLFTFTYLIVP